jgi:disintegrin and metalloproteinase domain-containing protein 10
MLNYGKRVPAAVSHVTLAHEIGHNFGSPVRVYYYCKFYILLVSINRARGIFQHDPEDDAMCTPGGEDGNYIMYARATSGDKKNNVMFSRCSVPAINDVLNEKARGWRTGCFEGNN